MRLWLRIRMVLLVLLGDIVLFASLMYAFLWWNWMITLVWIWIVYAPWKRHGGFGNWRPKNIKQFLKNWKKL